MTNPIKLATSILAAVLLWPLCGSSQVTLTDIGNTAPTPGPTDISQLASGNGNPGGLNYYWDDGANHATTTGYTGQSFTTGSNPAGYTLTSLAIATSGGGGGTPLQSQSFTLCIYQLSGTGYTNATLLYTYTATGQLSAEGDWMQWTGLGAALSPNTVYAYGFGRSPGSPGDWELLGNATGDLYSGGAVCEIRNAGGKVTYSTTSGIDAAFDLGLSLPAAPIANPPVESPSYANVGVLAGTSVTLTASAAGSTPITYQWLTDGGSGGTLTNIPGAASSNLGVNTAGWANGSYQYQFIATNSFGSSTSSIAIIKIASQLMVDIGAGAPTPGTNDIYQLLNTQQNDDGFNYYTDGGAGHGTWTGQTFTTGTNSMGYVLNSLAWKSAGNGNSFANYQLYDLYVYSVSADGTTATLIATNQCYGGGTEGDWLEFVGLSIPLAPNSAYAYAFGRDSTATGWEHIADQDGNPYAGGKLMTIGNSAGGTITYGNSGVSDATFDLGLSISLAPHASQPAYTPNVNPVYAGTTVTLAESAVGGLPFSYQWLTDGGSGGAVTNIPGATGSNLVVDTTLFAAGSYNYAVIVTNTYGSSTSIVATLNVVPASAPTIVADISPAPANEGYVGQSLTFTANFTGTLPVNYQWTVDKGSGPQPISAIGNPSAISNVLVLTNLQLSDAGAYALTATNTIGGLVSASSTLTVFPDPAAPASGSYGAMILSLSPAAFWRLNETNDPSTGVLPTYDASGHNLDGRYQPNSQNGYDSIAGPQSPAFPGFETNNTALMTSSGVTNSWVAVTPVNLNTNAVTIAMWINPSGNVNSFAGLFMNRKGSDAAGFGFGGNANGSGMYELGYTWNTNSSATWGFHSGLFPVAGVWSFVALVVQSNQATIYLYYLDPNNGNQPVLASAVNSIAHGPEAFGGGTTLVGDDGNDVTRVFNGDIDDVSVFNAALTADQILALFSKATGLAPVAPSIATQPQSAGAYAGNTVSFTASGINGSSTIGYQWKFNGNNLSNGGRISGVLTPSLTISNVSSADAGIYTLFASNFVGNITSSNATLTVVTPVPGSYEAAVLANNPYAFWKLEETNDPSAGGVAAYDYVRGLNGVYQTGAQNGYNGVSGPQLPGLDANQFALATFANTANSYVLASGGNIVASNLTYTMWINPSGPVQNWAGLLMDRSAAGEGFSFGGATDVTGMSELGYTWNQNTSWSWDSFLFPPANQWSFVALVIQPSQATLYLINSNGVQTASDVIAHDAERFANAWHIGDDAQGGGGSRTFPGSISDVAVFMSALSGSQITSLYNAALQITPPVNINVVSGGGGAMTLSWSQGTLLQSTNLAGPWTTNLATSPYTLQTTNSRMFFKIQVK